MNNLNLISELLKNRKQSIDNILNGNSENSVIVRMFLLSVSLFAVYGVIIGSSQSILQALSSGVKLPLMFYLTTFICFPTLYFFLSFLGIKQSFRQLLNFMILCNTFISLVLAAFAPVSFFFLITDYSYQIYKFINCIIFTIAGFTGTYLFYRELRKLISGLEAEAYDKRFKGILFLRLWAVLFCIIGVQLSFTLSPFFGLPGEKFILFTNENSNFFSDILNTMLHLDSTNGASR